MLALTDANIFGLAAFVWTFLSAMAFGIYAARRHIENASDPLWDELREVRRRSEARRASAAVVSRAPAPPPPEAVPAQALGPVQTLLRPNPHHPLASIIASAALMGVGGILLKRALGPASGMKTHRRRKRRRHGRL